jgi:hypothetical protein
MFLASHRDGFCARVCWKRESLSSRLCSIVCEECYYAYPCFLDEVGFELSDLCRFGQIVELSAPVHDLGCGTMRRFLLIQSSVTVGS